MQRTKTQILQTQCQRCRERESMRKKMPRTHDPVFINARKELHRGDNSAKTRAVEIASLHITIVRTQIEDKLDKMEANGNTRYAGVDLAQVENDLQQAVEDEIMTATKHPNARSVLDAGERDECSDEHDTYKELEHILFERFWTRVHNLRNGSLAAPKANQKAVDATVADMMEQLEIDAEVREAIEALPEHLRRIVMMKLSQMTQTEIALALNVSESTISRQYAAAREALAELLTEKEE